MINVMNRACHMLGTALMHGFDALMLFTSECYQKVARALLRVLHIEE